MPDAPDPDSPPEWVAKALVEIVRSTVAVEAELKTSLARGIGGNRQYEVLVQVGSSPGITPSGVGTELGLAPSLVSQVLRRLTDLDLVERRLDPADHRVVNLFVTEAGQDQLAATVRAIARWWADNRAGVESRLTDIDPTGAASNPQEFQTPADMQGLMARVGRLYRDAGADRARAFGVRRATERYAIMLLVGLGRLRPSRLAEELRLSSSGASGLVNRLVDLGLVSRSHDPSIADRRAVVLELTERGAELAAGYGRAMAGIAALSVPASRAALDASLMEGPDQPR